MKKREKKIKEIIEDNTSIKITKRNLDIDLFEYGYMDSFDFLNLIVYIEKEFEINILPSKFSRSEINTIRKLVDIVMLEIDRNGDANNSNC